MPLHLIKLAVGAESLADLREWMAERMAEAKRRRAPLRHAHVTRMAPKRTEQVLDGGSLYWVVKGMISARQPILGLEPFVDADGIGRCKIWIRRDAGRDAPRAGVARAAVNLRLSACRSPAKRLTWLQVRSWGPCLGPRLAFDGPWFGIHNGGVND
jgi:hypothetical protein